MYNPLTQYKEQAISTMSKGELTVALFDEALKNIRHAILLMEQQDYTRSKDCTDKAQSIFRYLCVALNYNYDISNSLNQLYKFFNQEIIHEELAAGADGDDLGRMLQIRHGHGGVRTRVDVLRRPLVGERDVVVEALAGVLAPAELARSRG